MEYKRLNTLIHSIEQVKLLAMSMYQISDETMQQNAKQA